MGRMMVQLYKVEDLFQEDPENPDQLIFNIPNDITKALNLAEGDIIEWEITGNGVTFRKKDESNNEYERARAQKIIDNPGFEV
jgi:hypothetical protein